MSDYDKEQIKWYKKRHRQWKIIAPMVMTFNFLLVVWVAVVSGEYSKVKEELEKEKVKFHRITAKELRAEEAKFNQFKSMADSTPQLNSQQEAFLKQEITISRVQYNALDKRERTNYEKLAMVEYIRGLAQLRAIREVK